MKMRKAIILWIARVLRVSVNELVLLRDTKKMDWVSVRDQLPNTPGLKLICHYNNHMEVARFDGKDWFAISNSFSKDDEKLDKESWPDYWLLIIEPEQ